MASDRIYRRICPIDLASLEGGAFKVHRDVYNWLNAGPDSTMTSLRRVSVAQLCEQLGWSAANVKTALSDLHDMGLIVWVADKSLAYGHGLMRDPPQNGSHLVAISREIDRYISCAATAEARKIVDSAPYTVSRTVSVTVSDTTGSRKQESGSRKQDLLVAAAPAPVKPTPAKKDKAERINPTLEQTMTFFQTLDGFSDAYLNEAEACFYNYAKSDFCMNNGKPLKSWEATCRQWWANARPGGKYHKPAGGSLFGRQSKAPVGNAPDKPVGRDDTLRLLAALGGDE